MPDCRWKTLFKLFLFRVPRDADHEGYGLGVNRGVAGESGLGTLGDLNLKVCT
jgi:hypothetical protein